MTSAQWNRLKDLFQLALELRPEDRAEWLAREAGDDPELAAHAQALLDASDTPGGFLDVPLEVNPDDVTAMLAAAAIQPGDRVGQYEIVRELGRGGMGVVYLARDELGREVALKSLPPEVSANPARRDRLWREAIAAAKIVHPGIATLYRADVIDGHLFVASEFVNGRSLRQELAAAPFPAGRAVKLTLQIVDALGAVHAAGVVHRDLKPENVLLTLQGQVKVVDFGIAHVESDDGTRVTINGVVVGTLGYMAPEQLGGGAVDARTDVFAVGVLLREMLDGLHPLAAGERPALPQPLGAIVSRCLQADPDARFQSTTELHAALEAAAAGRHTPDQEARWWWRFHQGVVGLAYAGLLVPAWMARSFMGGRVGLLVFLLLMTGGIVAITLRLHLWFVSLKSGEDLPALRAQTRPWLRLADAVFAAGLLGSGLFVGAEEPVLAIVLSGAAVIATVAFLVIEPSTARAAFRDEQRSW